MTSNNTSKEQIVTWLNDADMCVKLAACGDAQAFADASKLIGNVRKALSGDLSAPETPNPDDLVAALAHRGCCGTEHDPANGKLHGYCVVCGVPWPCETAKRFLRPSVVETSDEPQLSTMYVSRICTAYESGFGRGESKRDLAQPYAAGTPEALAYFEGYTRAVARQVEGAQETPAHLEQFDDPRLEGATSAGPAGSAHDRRPGSPPPFEKASTDRAAIDASALADAHRMYEAEHGEPFQSKAQCPVKIHYPGGESHCIRDAGHDGNCLF